MVAVEPAAKLVVEPATVKRVTAAAAVEVESLARTLPERTVSSLTEAVRSSTAATGFRLSDTSAEAVSMPSLTT